MQGICVDRFTHLMTKARDNRALARAAAEVADLIEPELEATTDEILATIALEVPDYARPLEGSFGQGVRTGVSEALRQFVELIRSPSGERGPGREVYAALGAGELREGRTLDALQSAYRVGARVAWRRLAAAATRAGVDPEVLSLLAESIFAYIEELSADSVEGYAEARSRLEGEQRHRRRELVTLLVRDPPAAEADLRAVAEAAGWRVPRTAAALACDEERLERLAARLPTDAVTAALDGIGCAIIPDPDGPGRRGETDRAVERARTRAALGPTGPLHALAASWSLARATLRAVEAGAIEAPAMVRAEDALTDCCCSRTGRSSSDSPRAGSPRSTHSPRKRADEWRRPRSPTFSSRATPPPCPARWACTAQTARYRLSRLRELLGDALDDPDARFELELALRARLKHRAV